jgi:steroid delta-isomerase-like uncharacterized protein
MLRAIEEERPCFGQRDVPSIAVEQAYAELLFELPDLNAERRLAHVKPRSGPTEMQLLGNRNEGPKEARLQRVGSAAHTELVSQKKSIVLDRIRTKTYGLPMTNPKETLIRRYFGELFNQGRVELVDELLHPAYVNHSPGSADLPRGREGVRIVVEAMRRAFPDLHYAIEDMVVGLDAVAVRATMRGTHRGDFFGFAPSGKAFEVAQMTIEHFRDERIVAHHRLTDEISLLRQLGAI